MKSLQSLSTEECVQFLAALHNIQDPSNFWAENHIMPLNGFLLSLVETFTDLRQYFPPTIPDLMLRHLFVKVTTEYRTAGVSFAEKQPRISETPLVPPEVIVENNGPTLVDMDEDEQKDHIKVKMRPKKRTLTEFLTDNEDDNAVTPSRPTPPPLRSTPSIQSPRKRESIIIYSEVNMNHADAKLRTKSNQSVEKTSTAPSSLPSRREIIPKLSPVKTVRKPIVTTPPMKPPKDSTTATTTPLKPNPPRSKHIHRSNHKYASREVICRYSLSVFLLELQTYFHEYNEVGKRELLRIMEMRLAKFQQPFRQSMLQKELCIVEKLWQEIIVQRQQSGEVNAVKEEQIEIVMNLFYDFLSNMESRDIRDILDRIATTEKASNKLNSLLWLLRHFPNNVNVTKTVALILCYWFQFHPDEGTARYGEEYKYVCSALMKNINVKKQIEVVEMMLNCLAMLNSKAYHDLLPLQVMDSLLMLTKRYLDDERKMQTKKSKAQPFLLAEDKEFHLLPALEACSRLIASLLDRDGLRAIFEQQQGLLIFAQALPSIDNKLKLIKYFLMMVGKCALRPCEQMVASCVTTGGLMEICLQYIRNMNKKLVNDQSPASLYSMQGVLQVLLLMLKQQPNLVLDDVCIQFVLLLLSVNMSASSKRQQTILLLGMKILQACIHFHTSWQILQAVAKTMWQVFALHVEKYTKNRHGKEEEEAILLAVIKVWIISIKSNLKQRFIHEVLVTHEHVDDVLMFVSELLQAKDASASKMKIDGLIRNELLTFYVTLTKEYPTTLPASKLITDGNLN